MNIVVCVKQTPAATNVPIDLQTGKLKTEGLSWGINPFDEYAVEEAVRLKERMPGSVVLVLSFGPDRAEEAIRAAVAVGADEGFLVSDPALEGSDSCATAHILAMAVRKIGETKGGVGVVLCGKQTSDVEAGQVGPSLGAWLDWPCVSSIKKIVDISQDKAVVERMMEDGVDKLEISLPLVISVTKEINEPRLPSLKGKMAAKKAPVTNWKGSEIGVDAGFVGAASPAKTVKSAPPPTRQGGMQVTGASADDKAVALVQKLKELKLI